MRKHFNKVASTILLATGLTFLTGCPMPTDPTNPLNPENPDTPNTSLIEGTEGDDILIGDEQDNNFKAFGGNDRMVLNGGSDIVDGGLGTDTVELSENKDSYAFTENTDGSVRATDGNDIITFNSVEEVEFADGSTENVEDLLDDGEEPVVDPDPVDPEPTGVIKLALSRNTSDPDDIETRRWPTTGQVMDRDGEIYTYSNSVVFEIDQFEAGKTYSVTGTAGKDRIIIVETMTTSKLNGAFNIVANGVMITNGTSSHINYDVTVPINSYTNTPKAPFTRGPVVSGVHDGDTITGTPYAKYRRDNGTFATIY